MCPAGGGRPPHRTASPWPSATRRAAVVWRAGRPCPNAPAPRVSRGTLSGAPGPGRLFRRRAPSHPPPRPHVPSACHQPLMSKGLNLHQRHPKKMFSTLGPWVRSDGGCVSTQQPPFPMGVGQFWVPRFLFPPQTWGAGGGVSEFNPLPTPTPGDKHIPDRDAASPCPTPRAWVCL